MLIASDSPQRFPYATFRNWLTVEPHLVAKDVRCDTGKENQYCLKSMGKYYPYGLHFTSNPYREFPNGYDSGVIQHMDIRETRRQNLLRIVEERFKGNRAAFARAIERPAPNVHRWLKKEARDFRYLDELTARDIEKKLGLPSKLLDLEAGRKGSMAQAEQLLADLQRQGVPEAQVVAVLTNLLDFAKAIKGGGNNP